MPRWRAGLPASPESQRTLLFFAVEWERKRDVNAVRPALNEAQKHGGPDRNVRAYRPGINCPMNHASYHAGQFLCACLALITPRCRVAGPGRWLSIYRVLCWFTFALPSCSSPRFILRDAFNHPTVDLYADGQVALRIGREIGAFFLPRRDSLRDIFLSRIRARGAKMRFSVYTLFFDDSDAT